MQMMALACSSMNMTPAEAISVATINAAHAIRYASEVGSLECGKGADLLVLGASDYRELPYHFGVNLVDLVMANGEILARRSEVRWPAH
jgi:imidazolonepropionase